MVNPTIWQIMKRWLLYAAIAWALSACALHTREPVRGDDLEVMSIEMMGFIEERSDLAAADFPPNVVFVEDIVAVMSVRYGDRFTAMMEDTDATVAGGFYDYGDQTIYLPVWWSGSTTEQSWLFHEIVHYLQHVNGRNRCASANEREAYDLERLWIGHTTGRLPPRHWMDKFIPDGCSAS